MFYCVVVSIYVKLVSMCISLASKLMCLAIDYVYLIININTCSSESQGEEEAAPSGLHDHYIGLFTCMAAP